MKEDEKLYTCYGCATEAPICMLIDSWIVIDNKYYCMNCQKDKKIGFYEKKNQK